MVVVVKDVSEKNSGHSEEKIIIYTYWFVFYEQIWTFFMEHGFQQGCWKTSKMRAKGCHDT